MLKKIGAPAQVSSNADDIAGASKLILPGVGAFDAGMNRLAELNLIDLLNDKALNQKTPTLGVCLGMQLLMRKSEEGVLPGLGWIEGETVRFRFDSQHAHLKIPHMGWNTIALQKPGALFAGLDATARFYFVHSYHVACDRADDVVTMTDYGYAFASALERDNIFGAQFHPEKSHKFGMRVLKNFVER
jgi:glutamine amidotransferase